MNHSLVASGGGAVNTAVIVAAEGRDLVVLFVAHPAVEPIGLLHVVGGRPRQVDELEVAFNQAQPHVVRFDRLLCPVE